MLALVQYLRLVGTFFFRPKAAFGWHEYFCAAAFALRPFTSEPKNKKIKAAEAFPAAFVLRTVMLFRRLVASLFCISVKHHFSVLNGTASVLAQAGPRKWQLPQTR